MSRVFVVVIGCDNPSSAELLKHKNGETKTWTSLNDSEKVVDEINEREGCCSALPITQK